jgi:hypothetical protein
LTIAIDISIFIPPTKNGVKKMKGQTTYLHEIGEQELVLVVDYRYIPEVRTNWNCPMEDAEPPSDADVEFLSATYMGEAYHCSIALQAKIAVTILEDM